MNGCHHFSSRSGHDFYLAEKERTACLKFPPRGLADNNKPAGITVAVISKKLKQMRNLERL
jgi:hypothetical protein